MPSRTRMGHASGRLRPRISGSMPRTNALIQHYRQATLVRESKARTDSPGVAGKSRCGAAKPRDRSGCPFVSVVLARSDADSTKQPGAEPQPTRTHCRPPVHRQLSHRCPSDRRPSFDSTVKTHWEMLRPAVASRMEQLLHQLPAQRVSCLDCRAFTQVAGLLALRIGQGAESIRRVELVAQRTKAGSSHDTPRGCTLGPVS